MFTVIDPTTKATIKVNEDGILFEANHHNYPDKGKDVNHYQLILWVYTNKEAREKLDARVREVMMGRNALKNIPVVHNNKSNYPFLNKVKSFFNL